MRIRNFCGVLLDRILTAQYYPAYEVSTEQRRNLSQMLKAGGIFALGGALTALLTRQENCPIILTTTLAQSYALCNVGLSKPRRDSSLLVGLYHRTNARTVSPHEPLASWATYHPKGVANRFRNDGSLRRHFLVATPLCALSSRRQAPYLPDSRSNISDHSVIPRPR